MRVRADIKCYICKKEKKKVHACNKKNHQRLFKVNHCYWFTGLLLRPIIAL